MSVENMYSGRVEPFCRVKEHDVQNAFAVGTFK